MTNMCDFTSIATTYVLRSPRSSGAVSTHPLYLVDENGTHAEARRLNVL